MSAPVHSTASYERFLLPVRLLPTLQSRAQLQTVLVGKEGAWHLGKLDFGRWGAIRRSVATQRLATQRQTTHAKQNADQPLNGQDRKHI